MKLTVVIPIYMKNDALQFSEAVGSVLRQTMLPDEILVVADGAVSEELDNIVSNLIVQVTKDNLSLEINYLKLEKHEGLGTAMNRAVEIAKGDFIARMDADDISLPDRFEKQMKCFDDDNNLSVVGGQIAEFDGNLKSVTGRRVVPLEHDDIANYMKSRNGMNHVTTILKKKDLIATGSYQSFHFLEDYYLWVRMISKGFVFKNIPDDVVMVRAGKEQMDRRGGIKYLKQQVHVFKYMLSIGFISFPRFLLNILERSFVHTLLPVSLRSMFYQTFLRK